MTSKGRLLVNDSSIEEGNKMFIFYVLLPIFFLFSNGYCERTKEKIYVEIKSGGRSPCFRRLNGTHQIGCTSDPKGNVGVVYYVNNTQSDLDWLLNEGPHKPYAVLLNPKDFHMKTVKRLLDSGKVNGIMVIQVPDKEHKYPPAEAFSPDQSCPNQGYGLYSGDATYGDCSKNQWNSVGEGLMFQDIGIPIFVLKEESDVDFIIEKCYKKFNAPSVSGVAREYPLCAVQLKDRMDGAKDSETCTRRTNHQMNLNPDRYCDPLGDQNVYATVKDVTKDMRREEKSVIVVAARMDSFSMFEDNYPSADNHVSGIVALLAVSEAIGKVKDKIRDSNTTKDVMFTFFQGEAFDYIGSGRMVYDMEHNEFPPSDNLQKINLKHISHFVEVNQLAYRDDGKIWIHTDPLSRPKIPEVEYMVTGLKDIDPSLIDEVDKDQPLPPASAQSFLKKTQLPTVVITDHRKEYTNKFYNSRLDLASNIKASCPDKTNLTECYDTVSKQASNLTPVANLLAKFLYTLATGDNSTDNVTVDVNTVQHLLFCYLISPNCELFKQSLDKGKADQLADEPYQFYVGVNTQTNNYTALTKQMLLVYLGDHVENATKDTCKGGEWVQGPLNENGTRTNGYCVRGNANLSKAVSKAFEIDDYDFKSRQYSTWAESSWQFNAMNVRVFLIPSKKFEVVTLVVGVLILVISLVGGYFFNKRSSLLFESNPYETQAPVSL
ncbi:nicastrin-like isoform X2 [Ruditapes philippinarum]|uniref:nicastrin-like isoform X2 n=1 Tax=Ruditapes philippinarum TaxID=129788 RepID=UPI00295C1237|nr:nicastrin-like isoform X2 [Ruditapes philippinarum]